MNRLFLLTMLFMFWSQMLHMRKLRCTSKEWMNTSMRHHALLQTGFHGPPNWQNRARVTFAKLSPLRLRHAAIVHG